MNSANEPNAQQQPAFPTLATLRRYHTTMLRRQGSESAAERPGPEEIEDFMRRAKATGKSIAASQWRDNVQGIIDYWYGSLVLANRDFAAEVGSLNLDEFDSSQAVPDSGSDQESRARAEAALADKARAFDDKVPAADRPLLRRLLLRLFHLSESGSEVVRAQLLRSDDILANPEAARLVNEMVENGLLKAEFAASGTNAPYVLATDSLLHDWPTLRDLVQERRSFRELAFGWKNSYKSPEALLVSPEALPEDRGSLLDLATDYVDPSGLERDFLSDSRQSASIKDKKRNRTRRFVITLLLVLVGLLGWAVFEIRKQRQEATARGVATQALQLLDERLDTSLLLATEAHRLSDLPATLGALLTAAYYNPRLKTYLHGAPKPIGAVAFSHNGEQVATGDYDGSVVLWDVKTHRKVTDPHPLKMGDAVRAIAFSDDDRYMAVSSKDKAVVLRDRTGRLRDRELPEKSKHQSQVWALAFSSGSTLLASGGQDGKIVIWNVKVEGDDPVTLPLVNSAVRALSFDPKAQMLVAGCLDGRILIWDRQGNEWKPSPREYPDTKAGGAARCLMVSPLDGKYLAVGRNSGAVELYELSVAGLSLKVVATEKHERFVTSLAFSADSERLITSANDGTLRLWEVPSLAPVGLPFTGHVGRVYGVAFSGDSRTAVSGGEDRRAILWDTKLHVARTVVRTQQPFPPEFPLAYSPDAAWAAQSYKDGSLTLMKRNPKGKWEYLEQPLISVKQPTNEQARKNERAPIFTFSGDSHLLATATPDGKLHVYDLKKAFKGANPPESQVFDVTLGDAAKNITAVGISRDASMIAASITTKNKPTKLLVWRMATPKAPLFEEELNSPNNEELYAVEFSPDGKSLVTGGDAEHAAIWSLSDKMKQTGECKEEHTGWIRSVAFSPNGEFFATASGDGTLIVWNTKTLKSVGPPLTGHLAPVDAVTFSHDGKLLASGSDDRSVILWDVKTGLLIGRLAGHTDAVRTLAFSPDGKRLCSGSFASTEDGEGGLLEWELDPDTLMERCRKRSNRNLTKAEWHTYIGSGDYHKAWLGLPVPEEDLPPK